MISKLARDDFEDLKAQGLNPTLDDFDRLNQLALRLTDGAETTCANFPRVGWAGDVPFYQPTLAAFAWYHGYAARLAEDDETANTFWFFALAHAREPNLFDALRTRDEIEKAVRAWAESMPVTQGEIARACRYAVTGFDDAPSPTPTQNSNSPRFRADRSEAAKNLARVEKQLVAVCAALKCPPDALMGETQTRLDALCEAAAIELGKPMSKDEAKLKADYDLTLRDIARRLKAEKEEPRSPMGVDKHSDDTHSDKDACDDVIGNGPLATGAIVTPAAEDVSDTKPENIVVVVAHDDNNTKSADGGQE